MEVAQKPVCIGKGCGTELRNGNIERKTCDRCDDKGVRAKGSRTPYKQPKSSAVPYPDASEECDRGHNLRELGRTRYGTCFVCSQDRNEARRPRIRYFHLEGLAKQMGNVNPLGISEVCALSYEQIRQYRYKGKAAPEDAAEILAEALDCTVDDLKWGDS